MSYGTGGVETVHRNQTMAAQALASDFFAATATAGAATVATPERLIGKVTSESLTTAQNAVYTLTVTHPGIVAADIVNVTLANGTNSAASPMLGTVTPGAGSVVITAHNKHASAVAFNGTLVFMIEVIKALAQG
jgi:hypothetical protein